MEVRRLTSLYIKKKEEAFWLTARPLLQSTRVERAAAVQRQMAELVRQQPDTPPWVWKPDPRLGFEVPAGWARPSSRGPVGWRPGTGLATAGAG